MSAPDPIQPQHDAFEAYKAAHNRMLETMSFADAMAAKRAWWFFLNLVDADYPGAKVVPFPRRASGSDFGGAA